MSRRSLCRTRFNLQRHTVTKDTSGAMAVSAWPSLLTFRGDLQPASARTIQRYQQLQIQVSHTLLMFQDIAALAGDRIQTTDGTRTYKVEGYRRNDPAYKDWPYVADVFEEAQS